MATESGTENTRLSPGTDAAQELLRRRHWVEDIFADHPGEFDFFQAVRLLSRLGPGLSPPGLFPRAPREEVVRFGVNPEYWFPPSAIKSLAWPKLNAQREVWQPPQMTVNFLGLVGPQGVLPLVYSEFVMDRVRARDHSALEFLDLFHHRILSLFYQAWEKYRFWVSYERGEADRMSGYLMDMLGLGTPGLENRQEVSDTSLLFYTGLLSLLPRSAMALEQFLSDYFDVPITVEQFGGSWYKLNPEDTCQFADPATEAEQLGFGVVVGDAVFDRASRARLRVGPMPLAQYMDFLPGGAAAKPLAAILKYFTGGEIIFEVQLVLARDSVPKCVLGEDSAAAPMLGWVTWMNQRSAREEDPGDTVFVLD
ncbi:MAG: type VI secretion system baseplate subunit TssG [Bryobacter sp.]|nr:type VI secretion system baseplate subunit TssG [Bryobacter sp.]